MPKNLPHSLPISQILVDLAAAVGDGSAALIRNSQTPIGLLAVKSAEVSVDFEITSVRANKNLNLGARLPLFYPVASLSASESAREDRLINKGSVKLNIVGVATALAPPEEGGGETAPPAHTVSREMAEALRGFLETTVSALISQLEQQRAPRGSPLERTRMEVLAELSNIRQALREGRLEEAARMFRQLTERHQGGFGA